MCIIILGNTSAEILSY